MTALDGETSVATTLTIQYRPIGTETWKKFRSISASRTASGPTTVTVTPATLKSITGFRVIAEGLESEVSTVSVKARLTAPVMRSSVKRTNWVTIKGQIFPRHAVGSHPVTVTLWKKVGGDWVEQATFQPAIVGRTPDGSKWQTRYWFGAYDKGSYRLQVSHEDLKHAASVSHFKYMRVR
ncbi:MAG: hypothetical protein HGB10_09465 [Coriobacteriia bacterium]|nr:hypothetical protein [Coriobacteriia bacterium]